MPLEGLIPTHIVKYNESIIKAAIIYSEVGQVKNWIYNQKYQSGRINGAIFKL